MAKRKQAKPKQLTEAERQRELQAMNVPMDDATLRRVEALLQKMLSSPPDPSTPKTKKKARKRAK